jgi:hypothetical protein
VSQPDATELHILVAIVQPLNAMSSETLLDPKRKMYSVQAVGQNPTELPLQKPVRKKRQDMHAFVRAPQALLPMRLVKWLQAPEHAVLK